MAADQNRLPNYLTASTPELLRGEMLKNNLRLKAEVKYQDMQELKNGSWICWYYDESPEFEQVMRLVNLKKGK